VTEPVAGVGHTGVMAHVDPSFTVVLVGDPDVCESLAAPMRESETLLITGIVGPDDTTAIIGRAPDVVVLVHEDEASSGNLTSLAVTLGRALPASRLLVAAKGARIADPSALIDGWVGGIVDVEGEVSLVESIERLATGEGLLDAGLAAAVLRRHAEGGSSVPLTPTEEEVLRRLAAGDSAETLAAEYAVSPRLVRLHAGGALARLHPVA
jgi:DNA-binding NarL/FixJ family response regulator